MDRSRRLLATAALVSALAAACTSPNPSTAPVSTPAPTATPAATALPTEAPTEAPTATPSPTEAPTPTPTPAPTATPSPTPFPSEAWQEHTSIRFQYSIGYPPNWFVTKGDATHADQFDGGGYPYVYVSRDTVGGTVSVALTVDDLIKSTKKSYKATVTGNKAISLAGGFKGRIVTFRGTDAGVPVTIQKVFVAKGREGYFLSLYAENGARAAGIAIFDQMCKSWRPR